MRINIKAITILAKITTMGSYTVKAVFSAMKELDHSRVALKMAR